MIEQFVWVEISQNKNQADLENQQGKIKLTQQKFYRIQLAQEYHDSNHNA